MLMAVCCRGMTSDETAHLTAEMLHSGETWSLAESVPGVVDKHSTGGVGDTVSLVLAPLLSAIGIPVAMMAGRGLGHSQGTIDKLEAIPGFTCGSDREWVTETIEACGAAIAMQSRAIAPADRVLYPLRSATATVPSLPLIVGSIMSKKLATGAAALVLDVKWGSGAFRTTLEEAREAAVALREVAADADTACEALITDMNQPLGPALGTACEVRAAIDVLQGGGGEALREVTVSLAEQAAVLVGRQRGTVRAELENALDDGRALQSWEQLVRAHGGDPDPDSLPAPRETIDVLADADGCVTAVNGTTLGWAAVEIGAGRRRRREPLAHGAGLEMLVRIGDRVEPGRPLARLLVGEREVDSRALTDRVRAAITIGEQRTEPPRLVLGPPDAFEG